MGDAVDVLNNLINQRNQRNRDTENQIAASLDRRINQQQADTARMAEERKNSPNVLADEELKKIKSNLELYDLMEKTDPRSITPLIAAQRQAAFKRVAELQNAPIQETPAFKNEPKQQSLLDFFIGKPLGSILSKFIPGKEGPSDENQTAEQPQANINISGNGDKFLTQQQLAQQNSNVNPANFTSQMLTQNFTPAQPTQQTVQESVPVSSTPAIENIPKQEFYPNTFVETEDSKEIRKQYFERAKRIEEFNADEKVTDRAFKLQDQFMKDKQNEEYAKIKDQVAQMDALLEEFGDTPDFGNNALDQSLISTFNKINDPGSVVRESEYARTSQGLSAVNRLVGLIDRLKKGGAGLTRKDREELVLAAKVIANERGKSFNSSLEGLKKRADAFSVPVEMATAGFEIFVPYELDSKKPETEVSFDINKLALEEL